MKNLNVTLFENSKRFAREAINRAIEAENNKDQWQFAILLITQAVELALKEKLHREHSLLVYTNPDNPKITVGTIQALQRLSNIPTVQMNEDDKRMIELVVSWRNRIVHHEFNYSFDLLKSAFARVLSFLADFYMEHFEESIREYLGDDEWGKVLDIQDYYKELDKRAMKKLTNYPDDSDVWACIMCAGPFVVDKDVGICLLCHYKETMIVCSQCGEKYLEWMTKGIIKQSSDGRITHIKHCDSCYDEIMKNIE